MFYVNHLRITSDSQVIRFLLTWFCPLASMNGTNPVDSHEVVMPTKKEKLQIYVPTRVKEWITQYQKEQGCSTESLAALDLIEFAIRIKENAKDDTTISNRELLEEILSHVLVTEKVCRNTLGYAFEEGKLMDENVQAKVKTMINNSEEKAIKHKEEILIKE